MPGSDKTNLSDGLAHELAECRQRGIDRLDVDTYKQRPVAAPELERLAAAYAASRGFPRLGRTPEIKALLLDALAALEDGSPADARLIRDLFFGDDRARVRASAGDLLRRAQSRYGEPSEGRFREIRKAAFRDFARFLADFAATAGEPGAPAQPPAASSAPAEPTTASSPAPGPERGWVEPLLEVILQFSLEDPGYSGKLTIDEHQKIIEAHGHCWWGWFRAKHDDDHSAEIAQRIRNCDVGLWERSESLFYIARCNGAVTNNGQPVKSPDPHLTPEYYRSEPYPAWFSFRSIRKTTAQEFQERFGDLPTTRSTICWSPEVSEPVIARAGGSAILHLSDLRFGSHHRWRTPSAPRRGTMTADQAIIQTLLMHNVDLSAVGAVVICGNFASGQPAAEAYTDALAFVDGLCEQLPGIERDHIVIVPGSDDFARPGDRERSGQALYREFHRRLYGDMEQDITRMRRYDFGTFRLNILPVNSVKLLGTDERDAGLFGYGYDSQLSVMRQDYLHNHGHTRVVNAVAAHHHLISTPVKLPEAAPQGPVRARVMPGMHDARDVLAKLSASRVALFLHGHLHEAGCYTVTSDDGWQTVVCGAGTAGASDAWLRTLYRDNHQNSLALYDVEVGRISGRKFVFDENHYPPPVRQFAIEDQQPRILQ